MSVKKEPLSVTVTVQAPLHGPVSVTLENIVPVFEPEGGSDAVAMMRRESRHAVDLMERAMTMVRHGLGFRIPDATNQESSPAEALAPQRETPASPRWVVEVYTSPGHEKACQSTTRLLRKLGVTFFEIKPAKAGPAHHREPLAYGVTAIPGVIVREVGTNRVVAVWGGHRPDLIDSHFAAKAKGGDQ